MFRNSAFQRTTRDGRPPHVHGFTLVEMLVAVALVLLMMSLFAEIFSLATGSMLRQKGIAENDQRARMVITLLKGDLEKRTFREVIPFEPGVDTDIRYLGNKLQKQRGYLSYSENNPNDDTDDSFRLTIEVGQIIQNKDTTPLYGRATAIGAGGVAANPNQPKSDDGQFTAADSTGMSPVAEIVYFLRAGRLYRRQMLIRSPYINDGDPNPDPEPTIGNPPTMTPILGATYSYGSFAFWRDFDYSVFYDYTLGRPRFHGLGSLNNNEDAPAFAIGGGITVPLSLGFPHLRFGHSVLVASGIPKEFTGSADTGNYIGCFTHEETSHAGFLHPGAATNSMNNPFARTDLTLNPATNAVMQYENDPYARTGEDMLLANVLSFDVKIWDPGVDFGRDGVPGDFLSRQPYEPAANNGDDDGDGVNNNNIERGWENSDDGAFVDLGHTNPHGLYCRRPGDPNANPSTNAAFPSYGNRFDTWHPAASWDGASAAPLPPYRAMHYLPAAARLAVPGYQDYRIPNRGIWAPDTQYNLGDVVFSPNAGTQQGHSFVYRCIQIFQPAPNNRSGATAADEPIWPTEPDGTVPDNNVRWECVDNLIPVKALQFRIRYLDISTGLVRDLTLVQELTE